MRIPREKLVAFAILLLASVVNVIWLSPELRISRIDLNDNVLHYTLVERIVDAVRSGENPLDTFDRYDPSNADTAQLQRGVERLRQLEKAAPKEIKDDVKVLVDTSEQIVKALDATAKHQPVTDLTAAQVDQVRAASANVTHFATEQCGVTLDSGSSAPTSTVPTSS